MRKILVTYLPTSMLLAFLAMILLTCGGEGDSGGIATTLNNTAIAADTAHSGSIPVNWRVSGTIVSIPIPGAAPEAPPAFLIQAFVKGAPGKAQFTVIGIPTDFNPTHPECGGGPGQNFSPNDMVITFEDLSMIFAKLDDIHGGWICFDLDGVTAVANMIIDGGTGKYEGAGGYFRGEFEGQQGGDSGLLQAETGTIIGEIEWKDL